MEIPKKKRRIHLLFVAPLVTLVVYVVAYFALLSPWWSLAPRLRTVGSRAFRRPVLRYMEAKSGDVEACSTCPDGGHHSLRFLPQAETPWLAQKKASPTASS